MRLLLVSLVLVALVHTCSAIWFLSKSNNQELTSLIDDTNLHTTNNINHDENNNGWYRHRVRISPFWRLRGAPWRPNADATQQSLVQALQEQHRRVRHTNEEGEQLHAMNDALTTVLSPTVDEAPTTNEASTQDEQHSALYMIDDEIVKVRTRSIRSKHFHVKMFSAEWNPMHSQRSRHQWRHHHNNDGNEDQDNNEGDEWWRSRRRHHHNNDEDEYNNDEHNDDLIGEDEHYDNDNEDDEPVGDNDGNDHEPREDESLSSEEEARRYDEVVNRLHEGNPIGATHDDDISSPDNNADANDEASSNVHRIAVSDDGVVVAGDHASFSVTFMDRFKRIVFTPAGGFLFLVMMVALIIFIITAVMLCRSRCKQNHIHKAANDDCAPVTTQQSTPYLAMSTPLTIHHPTNVVVV